jgi:class 3 adenylate cyclase
MRVSAAMRLRIRAGIHTGEVDLDEDGDVHGVGVHIAARLAAAARPDQLLASAAIVALTAGSAIAYRDLGSRKLTGIGPWPVVEVTHRS